MKNIIRKNFDRASKTYNNHDDVQKKTASYLVDKILDICPHFYPSNILDIGCGTGNLSKDLNQFFPKSTYHINDISIAMIKETINQFPNKPKMEVVYGDIEKLNSQNNYDLIASNMCLQWMDDLKTLIEKLRHHSKIIAFSCLLDESFREWYNVLKEYDIAYASRSYPSYEALETMINNSDDALLHSSKERYILSFDNARASAQYLRNIGANTAASAQMDFKKVSQFLKDYNKPCDLVYDIGFFIIRGKL